MHVYEVTLGIYKIFSWIASLKTYSHGYFHKQQNETGYFCGMTLINFAQHKTLEAIGAPVKWGVDSH